MAIKPESLNSYLFALLRSRGYEPTMLGTDGKELPVPEEAEVFQFSFIKDGEDYGPVTLSIDGLNKLVIYYGDNVANSPSEQAHSEDTSWYTLLNLIKRFSQKHQLSFQLKNTDHLKHDMAKRTHMKKIDESNLLKNQPPKAKFYVTGDNGKTKLYHCLTKYDARKAFERTHPDVKVTDIHKDGDPKQVEEQAKWRRGYSASGHPAGYIHKNGEVGPVGGTFTDEPADYDGGTKKVPVQKHRDKEDELSSRAATKLSTNNKPLLPRNAQRNLKGAIQQSKGKHGPVGVLPEAKKVDESYYATGKKSSYSDAVPQVKIILQHSRQLAEGERRYRAIEKIFVENAQGERFAIPTNKPGLARVYARHIAEGGSPYDSQGKHIHSMCEEYSQMSDFVRATRTTQFNESTQPLINEAVAHYQQLKETLTKLAGARGYHAYFESWTPALMEDEDTTDLSEMFAMNNLDPRIESVMPILRKLNKSISEMTEVVDLGKWADDIIESKGDDSPRLAFGKRDWDAEAEDKPHDKFLAYKAKGGKLSRRQWEEDRDNGLDESFDDSIYPKRSEHDKEESNRVAKSVEQFKNKGHADQFAYHKKLKNKDATAKKVDEVSAAAMGYAADREHAASLANTTPSRRTSSRDATATRPWTLVLNGKIIGTDKNVAVLRALQQKRGGKIVRQGEVAEQATGKPNMIYHVYQDSKKGVMEYLQYAYSASFLKELDLATCKFRPDPQVRGVWAVDSMASGYRCIIYLAGYNTPFGDIREHNDNEEGGLPFRDMELMVQRDQLNPKLMQQWVKFGGLDEDDMIELVRIYNYYNNIDEGVLGGIAGAAIGTLAPELGGPVTGYKVGSAVQNAVSEGRFVKGHGGVPLDRRGNHITPVIIPPQAKDPIVRVKRDSNGFTKEDYSKVWRKIEEVVSNIFPDGDPVDWLAPWLNKSGIKDYHVGEVLDKACKLNGYKDIYAYYDSFKTGDYGYGDTNTQGMAEASGSAPWASNWKRAALASKKAQQSPSGANHKRAADLHRQGASDMWGPYKDKHEEAAAKHEKSMKRYEGVAEDSNPQGIPETFNEGDDQLASIKRLLK